MPSVPTHKGKRQYDKLPFELTSDHYIQQVKAKTLKKQAKETAKEERKRLREAKKDAKTK